jgi:RND family efflux transporter MFP subunit
MTRLRTAALAERVALFVVLVVVVGCKKPTAAPSSATAVPVKVVMPLQRMVTPYDEFIGRVEAVDSVELRARVPGYLTRILVGDGATVQKDQPLYEIDARPYQAELDRAKAQKAQAEASLASAERQLKRMQELFPQGAATQLELENAMDARDKAAAALQAADAEIVAKALNVEYSTVRAPVAGRIGRALVSEGNLVSSDVLLGVLVSYDPIYVTFDMDELSIQHYMIRARQTGGRDTSQPIREAKIPIRAQLATDEGFPHEGVIDFADVRMTPGAGTVLVRGVFSNANGLLAPGFFARVQIRAGPPGQRQLVPERAIVRDQDRRFVYVVKDDGTIEARSVELGPRVGEWRAVLKGVESGDKVVVDGVQRARTAKKAEAKLIEVPPPAEPTPTTRPSN